MPTLSVDANEALVAALKARADTHGISVEDQHLKILTEALLKPIKKSFAEILIEIPSVGLDSDFERIQGSENKEID